MSRPDHAHGGAPLITPQVPVPQSVLIVDRSDDTREVLRTVLEARGLNILEASGARQGADLAQRFHPEVIVLDAESDEADNEWVHDRYEHESTAHHSHLLVLGRNQRFAATLPIDRIMPKPYHYAPLIRKIEELLD